MRCIGLPYGRMAELADAPHLRCGIFRCVGSNPTLATIWTSSLMVEQAAHNGWVSGSSPERSTISPYSIIGKCTRLLSVLSGFDSLWGGQYKWLFGRDGLCTGLKIRRTRFESVRSHHKKKRRLK